MRPLELSLQGMSKSQISGTSLLVAVAAAAVAVMIATGPLVWLASIAGLVLAMVLLAYDREGQRSAFESLAFSAVFGFCVAVAFAAPLAKGATAQNRPTLFGSPITLEWMPLVWAAATLVFWMIDMMRMSGRAPQIAPAASSSSSVFSLASAPADVAAARPAPVEIRPEPASMPSEVPETPAPFSTAPLQTTSFAPLQPSSSAHLQTASSAPLQALPASAPFEEEPVGAPVPPVQPVAVPRGPETTVYVALVGEGLNVLRAVKAEHVGRDFYRITEQMPEGETWQFGPGQVVRCKKKNLSTGKGLVATEEAPRAS